MIRTRPKAAAELVRDAEPPTRHVRLRSPQRGTLIGVRLQAAEIAELERRCRPGQSLADVVRQELRRAFTKP